MISLTLYYVLMAICGLGSVVAVFLAIVERDMLKAVLFSAIQSTLYAFLYYLLMAPDIVLTYIPVSVGLYPAVILFLIKKTERFEDVEMKKGVLWATGLLSLVFVIATAAVIAGKGIGPVPPPDVRFLAGWYLATTFNPRVHLISAMAPEGVTSIVWDYRGLDTVFETAVLFLAIIASVALMRGVEHKGVYDELKHGMTLIGKTITKIVVPLIIGVGISIALHGHLTPGGGFQGGSALAVAPLLVLVVFSKYFFDKVKFTKTKALAIRSSGLLGVGLTAFAVLIAAIFLHKPAYILQNQPRVGAPLGFPWKGIDGVLLGGSLLSFNACEAMAVCAGFVILFLLLSIPERYVRSVVVGGEEHEH